MYLIFINKLPKVFTFTLRPAVSSFRDYYGHDHESRCYLTQANEMPFDGAMIYAQHEHHIYGDGKADDSVYLCIETKDNKRREVTWSTKVWQNQELILDEHYTHTFIDFMSWGTTTIKKILQKPNLQITFTITKWEKIG